MDADETQEAKGSMSHDSHISSAHHRAPASGSQPLVLWTVRELAGYSDEAFWTDFARASKQRQEKIERLVGQCGDQNGAKTASHTFRQKQNASGLKSDGRNPNRVFSPTPFPHQKPTTAQKASLLAYMTLWDLLEQTYEITEAPLFSYENGNDDDQRSKGKPYLAGRPDIHFSLSHTKNAVLAAVATTPVGADIQTLRTPSESLLSRALSTKERRAVDTLEGQDRALAFTQIWTRKEAFLKMTGHGIQSLHDLKQEVLQSAVFEEGFSTEKGFAWSICAEIARP